MMTQDLRPCGQHIRPPIPDTSFFSSRWGTAGLIILILPSFPRPNSNTLPGPVFLGEGRSASGREGPREDTVQSPSSSAPESWKSPSSPPSSAGSSGSGYAAVCVAVFGPALATSGTFHTITCTSCSTPSNLWGWTKREGDALRTVQRADDGLSGRAASNSCFSLESSCAQVVSAPSPRQSRFSQHGQTE